MDYLMIVIQPEIR